MNKKSLLGILSIAAALAVPLHAQSWLTNGLVAYYPFNGNAKDASGNGNNGTVNGTDWQFSFDRFGQPQSSLFLNTTSAPAWNLDGAYVAAPRSAALDFNQDFTLSVWVNLSSGNGTTNAAEDLISNGTDSTSANLRILSQDSGFGGDDYLQFVCGPGQKTFALWSPVRQTWWQFTAVRSGSTLSLFRNGLLLTNGIITTVVNYPAIWFGKFQDTPNGNGSTYPLVGGIDDVRMYDRALSAAEVRALYQYESQPQSRVTTYFSTADPAEWRVSGGGATNETPYEIGAALSVISGGDTGTYVAGMTNFTGFWLADYVFYLPQNASDISLTCSNLYVDDRGLLLLNGSPIAATGIPYFGSLNPGSLVYTDGGAPQPYSSFVGPNGSVSSVITNGFNIGTTNTLRVIVNNTHAGVYGSDIPVSSGGDGTYMSLSGALSYISPEPPSCAPHVATATGTVVNGFVVGATITDGGCGYANTPSVRIIGGGGTGAEAAAVATNGVVTAIDLLAAGSGYTNTPVVVIAPPFIPQPVMAAKALVFGPLVTQRIFPAF